MGYLSGQSGRNCVRCGKDLTDAASCEAGIGPVCRQLDNHVLATLIKADVGSARGHLATVPVGELAPETVATFAEVDAALSGTDAESVTDWRKTVKRIEWILSWPKSSAAAFGPFSCTAASLGYVGLAALWQGLASTGKATVTFEDGRIYVVGPKNPKFREEMKAACPSRKFHPVPDGSPEGTRPRWSVAAKEWAYLKALVATYYPVNEGLDAACAQAKDHTVPAVAPTPAPKTPAPKTVRCEVAGTYLRVFTPYNPEYISAIKAVFPVGTRRWNFAVKCWEVPAEHKAAVAALVQKHYGEAL